MANPRFEKATIPLPYPAITGAKWKELLLGVKERLQEGQIGLASVWRRYTCSTDSGRTLKLALGSQMLEDETWYFPFIEVKSKSPLPGEIRLGQGAPVLFGRTSIWKNVPALSSEFLARYNPICTNERFAQSILTEPVQKIVEELDNIHPAGITVLILRRSMVVYKLLWPQDADNLTKFVKTGMELAELVL